MARIVTIIGTRPEIIKMAPVVKALDGLHQDHVLVHSGQHYDLMMDRIFFRDMQLREPDEQFELKEQPPHLQVATTMRQVADVTETADLVIVQDAYHPTETTRFADVLLPAAQWPEKDGVMTSSERRLTYLPKLVEPPGEALPDAAILTRFADEMGWKEAFPCESACEIFDEFAALTAGAVCDYSGVSHARLRSDGPLQWPVPATDHPGTARLYTDGRFPTRDGRARFVAVEHAEPLEEPDGRFPLILTTGRVRDHWHTRTSTGKAPALAARTPEPILEVNLGDARRAGIQDGDFVEVTSRRGKAVAQCRVSAAIREGTCFLPFHWGREAGFYKSANNLTSNGRDPLSRQPELKACAVRLRRVAEAMVVNEAAP